jgi:hypothetical protein
MQDEFGKTDISEFSQERTVILWAAFLTGKNLEHQISLKQQWQFKLPLRETFFKFFDSFEAIDVPAFSYKQKNHVAERKLLADYFKDKSSVEEYENVVFKNHEENKKEFFKALGNFEILMGYFNLADAIGHLSFGIESKMKLVYEELDDLAKETKRVSDFVLIVADHGMKAIGRYGDHTRYGFYSLNKKFNLGQPKITDFFNFIKNWK